MTLVPSLTKNPGHSIDTYKHSADGKALTSQWPRAGHLTSKKKNKERMWVRSQKGLSQGHSPQPGNSHTGDHQPLFPPALWGPPLLPYSNILGEG